MKLAGPIQIVRLVRTILQFANVSQTMSETRFKVVGENVNLLETALNHKNANVSNVYLFVEKEVNTFPFESV